MNANLAAVLYLVAGVLFILSLRGLSSPATSRQGNFFGMIGMAIAVATTLASHPPADGLAWILVILGIAIGGSVGAVIARRVPMTSMPELVAAFHSLVGMAAVLVAAGAFYAPEAFDIGSPGNIHPQSLVEMSLGVAIGALTFTGSVIAFLKLSARMSGAPIILPFRHIINIALAIALVVFIVGLVMTGSALDFWLIVIIALALGVLMIIPIGGADMPVVISMLNSYSGWARGRHRLHPRQFRADHHRRAGGIKRRDPVLHHVPRDEPLLHLGHSRRLRRRDRGGRRWRRRAEAGQARLGRRRSLHHEERAEGHHRARLWHGGGTGSACAA
ncbi:NAD/NADP transhydrogenase beta subunit [Bradyrhizobium sp. GM7.3]